MMRMIGDERNMVVYLLSRHFFAAYSNGRTTLSAQSNTYMYVYIIKKGLT